jgi:hypothetical protein
MCLHTEEWHPAVLNSSCSRICTNAEPLVPFSFGPECPMQVSRAEMRDAVVAIYKERRNMARSLMDTETIVQSLEFGIGAMIHFTFSAIYLLVRLSGSSRPGRYSGSKCFA